MMTRATLPASSPPRTEFWVKTTSRLSIRACKSPTKIGSSSEGRLTSPPGRPSASLGWLGSDSIQAMTPSIRARASVPEASAMGAPRRPARRSSLARRRMASPRLSAPAISIFSQTPNSSRRSPNRGRNPLQDFFHRKFISTSRCPQGNPHRSGIQFLAHIDMHSRTLKMHRNLLEYP